MGSPGASGKGKKPVDATPRLRRPRWWYQQYIDNMAPDVMWNRKLEAWTQAANNWKEGTTTWQTK